MVIVLMILLRNISIMKKKEDDIMINIFKKPSKYIFNKIKKICKEKQLNFASRFNILYDNIIKFNFYLPELKNKNNELYNEINNNKFEKKIQ